MKAKILTLLWIMTLLAALGLLAATISLARQTRALAEPGFHGIVVSRGNPVFLRAGPSGVDHIITILDTGTAVHVSEEKERDGHLWARVDAGGQTGWVLADLVQEAPPE